MRYRFRDMEWNTLAEFDKEDSRLKEYEYLGKAESTKRDRAVFRFWKKGDQTFAEVLNDKNPDYFVPVDNLESGLEPIDRVYRVDDEVEALEKPVEKVLTESHKRGESYERFDPDIDEERFTDCFIGSFTTEKEFEKAMMFDSCVNRMPVRLPTADYIKESEYPILAVYKTHLSQSTIECFLFTKDRTEDYFPVFCRAVYSREMPVDLQKFLDNNRRETLDEYLKNGEEEGQHVHIARVVHSLRDHQLEEYVERNLDYFKKD